MLEWTGERFLPWIKEPVVAYEHLHRYAFAGQFVEGKHVLDLASGEGYGAKMLARTAASVTGIDIDEAAVRHAEGKYGGNNLSFASGSVTNVPINENHSFDIAVCFEAIEHVEDQEGLLQEVKRLLKPDGLFIVSTPNKAVYHDEGESENRFHVKELYFDEFRELLERHFSATTFLGQRIHPASTMWPLDISQDKDVREIVISRRGAEFEFIRNKDREALYFIALASSSLPPAYSCSVLIDHSNEMISAMERSERWLEEQVVDRNAAIKGLEEAIAWRENQIRELQEGIAWRERQVEDLEKSVTSLNEALTWRGSQVENLENEKATALSHLRHTQEKLSGVTGQLEGIQASSGWKLVLRARHLRDATFPPDSWRGRLLQKCLRAAIGR